MAACFAVIDVLADIGGMTTSTASSHLFFERRLFTLRVLAFTFIGPFFWESLKSFFFARFGIPIPADSGNDGYPKQHAIGSAVAVDDEGYDDNPK
jgi:hypothetical protein